MRKDCPALASLLFAVSLVVLLVTSLAMGQGELHATLTKHIPEAVSSGRAPMVGRLPATQRLSLAVSLPLRNENGLDELLRQIYNPLSAEYRQYLSVEEFTRRFGPSQSDYAEVISFARANGLKVVDIAANRMVVDVEGTAGDIEAAFHTNLNLYRHPVEDREFYAPDREPSTDLNAPVLHISGLDNFSLPHAKNIRGSEQPRGLGSGKNSGSGPGGDFVGSDLRAAYYGTGPLTGSGQSIGLFEFAGYEVSDVQNYFNKLNQPLNVPIKGVSLNGVSLNCPPATCDDSEQVLDIEISISMAPALSQVVVYVGASDVSIFNQMAVDNTSKQLSCSWGWSDDESSLDPIFKEMAVQGQTVFVATGDNGSSTPGDVVWPSDDPYVAAVGGTDLVTTGPGGAWLSETGWSGSAGMPSKNNIPIPPYQKLPGVVNSQNDASSTLRNIPDVASESNTNQWSCYDAGCYEGNGGTSYAAPQWAGFTAMANQWEVAHGRKTLGFLNTALYKIGVGSKFDTDFHDIVSGSNGKYSAVTGYDLVTGWGSPQAANLIP